MKRSVRTIERWISSGQLALVRFEGVRYVREDLLLAVFRKHHRPLSRNGSPRSICGSRMVRTSVILTRTANSSGGATNMDLGFTIVYLIGLVIGLAILYSVIRSAVRNALEDHYKVVRWYEHTGEWRGKRKPRDFPPAQSVPTAPTVPTPDAPQSGAAPGK